MLDGQSTCSSKCRLILNDKLRRVPASKTMRHPHHVVRRILARTGDRGRDVSADIHALACGRQIMPPSEDLHGFAGHLSALIAIEEHPVVFPAFRSSR